ncbi:MAG: T9SS type B sorting domain-containing protein, partial [Pedobacter sp.]
YSTGYDSFALCHTARYDECFNKLWSKTFLSKEKANYHGNWFSEAVTQTLDGGFVIADYHEEVANLWPVIHKLDANGKVIWSTKLYFDVPIASATGYGSAEQFIATKDSGVVVFGNAKFHTPNVEEFYYIITKLNKNGTIVWSKKYNLPKLAINCSNGAVLSIAPNNVTKLSDEGYLLQLGNAIGNIFPNFIRLDVDGNIIWGKGVKFNCTGYNELTSGGDAVEDKTGNIYLIAIKNQIDSFYEKPTIIKLNKSGNIIWSKSFDKEGWIKNIELLKNNTIAVQYHHYNFRNNNNRSSNLISTLDLDGNILWTKVFSNSSWGNIYYFTQTMQKDIYNDLLVIDSYRSIFTKMSADSLQSCSTKDTTVKNGFTNIKFDNVWFPSEIGYKMADGELREFNNKRKVRILCGKEFYPISDLGNDTIFYNTNSYTLRAGSDNLGHNHKFSWSNGNTDSIITVTKSGKYWLAISSGYCTNTDTVNIVFRDEIKSNLQDQSICPYDSVLVQSPKVNAANFYWIKPDKSIFSQSDIWAKDTGTYYLMLDGNTDCKNIDTFRLFHHPLPKSSAGPDTLLCYNQSYEMQGKGGIKYKWIPAKYLSNDAIANPIAKAPDKQLYMLVVKNAFGCADTSQMWLKVKPKLKVKLSAETQSICSGEKVKVWANANGGNNSNYTYIWNNSAMKDSAYNVTRYSYSWIKVTLQDGCSEPVSDSIFIEVTQMPVAAFYTDPKDSASAEKIIWFINQSQNATKYTWNFGNGKGSNLSNPAYIYTDTGKYFITLVAQNTNGCADTAFGNIYIGEKFRIFIPNSFTPDNDLINDAFSVYGTGIKAYSYEIYNRWGERIFTSSTNKLSWNGAVENKGETVQMDVYFYVLKVKDIENSMHYFNGTIYL